MSTSKPKRQRGVVPTSQGLKKLQDALLATRREDVFEYRLTQEKIAEETGLAIKTIRKVINREGFVSLNTLTILFSAFNLELESTDYTKPNLETTDNPQENNQLNPLKTYPSTGNQQSESSCLIDWGEVVDVSFFQGRYTELEIINEWIVQKHCRLVAILGMGGIGKTSLSVKLAQQLMSNFEMIIWRSLRNAPSLEMILSDLVHFLSKKQDNRGQIGILLDYLRNHRCLLILDNWDSVLQEEQYVGRYQAGYEGYGELLKRIGETTHQSCLIITSREKPAEIAVLEGLDLPIRTLILKGCAEAAQALLIAKGLSGTVAQKQQLAELYGNSPLAIKLVATSIQDLFDGNIGEFLAQDTIFFNNIRALLAQQFQRLYFLEQIIIYWLTINREWTSINQLNDDILPSVSRVKLLEALESLSWRSLIEKQSGQYTLQPVVMEYLTERLLEQVTEELLTLNSSDKNFCFDSINLLRSHALLKAQAQDTIRQMQTRLILEPLTQVLLKRFTTKNKLANFLKRILSTLRQQPPAEFTYFSGNILNLLCYLSIDLSYSDLSNLTILQTDFTDIQLYGVNFQNTNLAKTVFSKTFNSVYSLAFSPDNCWLVTGHADGEINLWQVETGQLLLNLKGHHSSVWTVAFNPDGETLASGSFDQTIKLWQISTGLEIQTLLGHQDWVRTVAFSPDGKLLASCSSDQTLKLWDSKTGQLQQTLTGHQAPVTTISFSPQGTLLVSGSEDKTLRLWDVQRGECLNIFEGHQNLISSVVFSRDGQILASCEEQQVRLWQVNTGECYQILEDNLTFMWTVAFSPDGEILAGSDGQLLKLWDVQTGNCLQIISGFTSQVWALSFSSDGKLLAGSDAESVRLWNVQTGECLRTWRDYKNTVGSYWSLMFSLDGKTLATGGRDGVVRLWNVSSGKLFKTLQNHTQSVQALAFSPDHQLLASGGEDHLIWILDSQSGEVRHQLLGHTGAVSTLAINHNSQILVSGSQDCTIKLWDMNKGQCVKTLLGHEEQVLSVKFSPDGKLIASGGKDRTIKIWDINTGECLKTLLGHQGWLWSVGFSPDGKIIASGSEDRTLKLWDVASGDCYKTLQGHTKLIWVIIFSQDGQTLISGSSDRTIKFWNVQTGECVNTFEGNTDLLWGLVELDNGQFMASGSHGEAIQLWKLPAGKLLKTLRVPRLYEEMQILGATGLTKATIANLKALGAINS